MGDIIGRAACPICGNTVAVKINKNRKLYAFCDYSCKFSLNSEMSRHGIAELAAGRLVTLGKLTISPERKQNGTGTTTGTTTGTPTASATGIDAGQRTGTATATTGTPPGTIAGTSAAVARASGISDWLGL